LTPEEAKAYKAAITAQKKQLISAETVEKSIGWLKQLEKDYSQSGLNTLADFLQQNRKTEHLKKTLTTYQIFLSLTPKERETWNCLPTTYEHIKRLNDEARECHQALKRQEKTSHLEADYQQLCLEILMKDPSR
jgi:hypothetical protein